MAADAIAAAAGRVDHDADLRARATDGAGGVTAGPGRPPFPRSPVVGQRSRSRIRSRTPFVAVVGLAIVVVAGCSSRAGEKPQHASLPGLTPKRLAALRGSAITAAANMGETHPTDGIVVATTQHAVFRAEPGGPKVHGPDFKVFVVAFAGELTAFGASRPPGTPPPTGRFAYAIHRADTLAVTDSGLLAKPFDLAPLGPHLPLKLESAQRQRAIAYAQMFLRAGYAPPSAHRVTRTTRVHSGLWRVEVRTSAVAGRVRYDCFTIRLARFFVQTSPTDEVSSGGIDARNRRCRS